MQSEDTWMELHTLHRHGWSIAAPAMSLTMDERWVSLQEVAEYLRLSRD